MSLLQEKLKSLPYKPGCYLMKDAAGQVIYVGKAKELHARVNSYFNNPQYGKTAHLVSQIADFDIIITGSEKDALILEINLIHHHFPKFNVLLKDGKRYPYITFTKEQHPRLKIMRYVKKAERLWGPFPTSGAAYRTVSLLNQLYPLRKCEKIPNKACLYYHIDQCLAPCIKEVTPEQYEEIANNIETFFKGEVAPLRKAFVVKMREYADQLLFEEADKVKHTIAAIDEVLKQQKVDFNRAIDIDVWGYQVKDDYLSLVALIYRSGTLIGKTGDIIALYDLPEEAITSYLIQYYKANKVPKTIYLPPLKNWEALAEALDVKMEMPLRGKRLDIVALAAENAIKQLEEYFLFSNVFTTETKISLLEELGSLLKITPPRKIELFDCSRLQGEQAVAAMVAFINCEAYRKGYRKYLLSEQATGDTQGIEEAISRRIGSNTPLPDLIIVDGGIHQVNAALAALDKVGLVVPVAGLVKNKSHKTEGLVSSAGEVMEIKRDSSLFHFLTRMQDEVHRFAISYFRQRKTKSIASSVLDQIPGVGQKRGALLFNAFGSIEAIKKASVEELGQYVPLTIAQIIKNFFNQ